MLLRDVSFTEPQKNIIFDDVLLSMAEEGLSKEALRFWESSRPFIVLGKISKPEDDIKIKQANEDKIPILRRSSGGGTVFISKGCLNYSVILSKEKHPELIEIRSSYQYILNKIIKALGMLGFDCVIKPLSDIVLSENEKKVSGNAQRRAKRFILHHGTLLYDFEINKIERYLYMPKNTPEYRKDRSHSDFLSNIPALSNDIKLAIAKVFKVNKKSNGLTETEALLINKSVKTNKLFYVNICS